MADHLHCPGQISLLLYCQGQLWLFPMHCRGHACCHLGSIPPSAAMCVVLSADFCYYHSQHRNSCKATGTSPWPKLQTPSFFIFTSALCCCLRMPCLSYFTYSPQTSPISSTGISFFTLRPPEPRLCVSTIQRSRGELLYNPVLIYSTGLLFVNASKHLKHKISAVSSPRALGYCVTCLPHTKLCASSQPACRPLCSITTPALRCPRWLWDNQSVFAASGLRLMATGTNTSRETRLAVQL